MTPSPLHPDIEDLARALAATRRITLAEARAIIMNTGRGS